MLLSNIIDLLHLKKIKFYNQNQVVKHITANSKLIKINSIFVTDFNKKIKLSYIDEAIKKKVVAILTNKKIENIKVPQLIVKNLLYSVDLILYLLKPYPPNNIVGITGTNGKTSVVWLVSSILQSIGLDVKSLGTLGYYKNLKKISDQLLTTPEREELHQLSYDFLSRKTEFVFEISSHAISRKRLRKLPINIVALTNITQDHLDYHKTFKSYKNAKFKLFLKYLLKKGTAIINDKVDGINYLKQKLKRNNINVITYGKSKSDVHCISFNNITKIKVYSKNYQIKFYATNNFDLENLACSVCCCLAMNLGINEIIKSIRNIRKPEGRMQLVNLLYNKAKIYVDYAHTPQALKNILVDSYYNFKKPNLVFGCGGDRDKSKRAKMGNIAYRYANKIYITDDNPRNENPDVIRDIIHFNCPKALNIGDRRLAIKTAIESLGHNETLIIAGKGHEKKQIINNKIIDFDDVKVANYYIKKRNYKLQ